MNWYKISKNISASFAPEQWKTHFDTFMTHFLKTQIDPTINNQEIENQIKKEAFEHWVNEIPSELRLPTGDIKPEFEKAVLEYCKQKWNFEPFPTESYENSGRNSYQSLNEEADIEPWSVEDLELEHNKDPYEKAPSVDELEEQWNPKK